MITRRKMLGLIGLGALVGAAKPAQAETFQTVNDVCPKLATMALNFELTHRAAQAKILAKAAKDLRASMNEDRRTAEMIKKMTEAQKKRELHMRLKYGI